MQMKSRHGRGPRSRGKQAHSQSDDVRIMPENALRVGSGQQQIEVVSWSGVKIVQTSANSEYQPLMLDPVPCVDFRRISQRNSLPNRAGFAPSGSNCKLSE